MNKQVALRALIVLGVVVAVSMPASAGIKVYEDGDKFVEIGGRVQLQYNSVDKDGSDTEDDLFFRRLRPYIKASVTKDWNADQDYQARSQPSDWLSNAVWTSRRIVGFDLRVVRGRLDFDTDPNAQECRTRHENRALPVRQM